MHRDRELRVGTLKIAGDYVMLYLIVSYPVLNLIIRGLVYSIIDIDTAVNRDSKVDRGVTC